MAIGTSGCGVERRRTMLSYYEKELFSGVSKYSNEWLKAEIKKLKKELDE